MSSDEALHISSAVLGGYLHYLCGARAAQWDDLGCLGRVQRNNAAGQSQLVFICTSKDLCVVAHQEKLSPDGWLVSRNVGNRLLDAAGLLPWPGSWAGYTVLETSTCIRIILFHQYPSSSHILGSRCCPPLSISIS